MTEHPADSPEKSLVFTVPVAGELSFVRVGPRSVSLGRGPDILNWDRAGRPFSGNLDGTTWHRALDGRIVRIETAQGGRHAHWLEPVVAQSWGELIRSWAEKVCDAGRGHDPRIVEAFEPAAAFDSRAWAGDAAAFAAVYRPVPILPPDQYLAVVLQATLGCSWNRCTFCGFYRDRHYAVRPAEEFRAHVSAVRSFFGRGLAVRRSIFLADANAVAAPAGRVAEWLDVVRERFPVRGPEGLSCEPGPEDPPTGFHGIHGFLDVAGGARRDPDEWALLAQHGLTTVFLGVETGYPQLLTLLGKPGAAGQVRGLVADIKDAGLAVGLIFLSGVGGREMAADHERASARLADELPLDAGDLVYVSPFDDRSSSEYRRVEREAGLAPLGHAATWEQARRMKSAMACLSRPGGPRGAIYDINLFAY